MSPKANARVERTARHEEAPNNAGVESRSDLAKWLAGHTRALLWPLSISVLARIVGQLLGVALFATAAHAIATASPANSAPVAPTLWLLAALAVGKAALRYLEHYAGHWVAFTSLQRLRELFLARLIPQVPAVALTWLGVSVSAPLALTLAAFVVAATIALPLLSSRRTWTRAGLVARQRGAIAQRVGDDVQGVREVLAFGIEEQRIGELAEADGALIRERSRAGRQHGCRAAAMLAIQLGGLIALALVGSGTGASGTEIAIALAVGVALWAPVQGVDGFAAGLDAAFAAAARIREVIEGVVDVTDGPGGAEPSRASLEADRVTFGYGESRTLSEVSAQFAPGEWSYVVGVSGSGKSTLARLAVRGWDPSEGAMRLGGVDVRQLRLDDLRGRVALVSQRTTMLSGTIGENLRLGAPGATDADLEGALEAVALSEWLDSLPERLASPIAERGLDVSGGQLQRLAVARALVAGPQILVLDEALSQLDAETARVVRERVAARGLTVVELTHRADLVPGPANVVVLDAGEVVESGRAADLRAAGGAFTQLEARN